MDPVEPTDEDRLRFTRGGDPSGRLRTVIGVCLDESGSMGEDDPEGGNKREAAMRAFNEYLAIQQSDTVDDCLMCVVKFNYQARVMQSVRPVTQINPLTTQNYFPAGGTALFDAIAFVVAEAEKVPADRYIYVVITDGENNASHETTLEQVRALITAKEAAGISTFTYLSAHADAFQQGQSMGMSLGNVGSFVASAQGMSVGATRMARATQDYRHSHGTYTSSFYQNDNYSGIVSTPTTVATPTITNAITPDDNSGD